MSDVYDVYGINSDLESAARRVSAALDVELVLHSSEYMGGYYYGTPFPDETIEVVRNGPYDDPDDVPYEEYSTHSVIVEISESPKCDEYRERLIAAGFEHLQREIIEAT